MLVYSKWNGDHIDGLVQDCRISSALAMEILQSCTKPSTCQLYFWNITKPQRCWHFVGGIHRRVDSLHKRPMMGSFDVLFDASLNTLLNKRSTCQWFKMPLRSGDVIAHCHFALWFFRALYFRGTRATVFRISACNENKRSPIWQLCRH